MYFFTTREYISWLFYVSWPWSGCQTHGAVSHSDNQIKHPARCLTPWSGLRYVKGFSTFTIVSFSLQKNVHDFPSDKRLESPALLASTSPTLAVFSSPPASCFCSSGFFHNNFPMRLFAGEDMETKRERGVGLEVGLQYLSSQSQSTGPVLGKTRHSIDKDVKNSSKWPTFNLDSVGKIR